MNAAVIHARNKISTRQKARSKHDSVPNNRALGARCSSVRSVCARGFQTRKRDDRERRTERSNEEKRAGHRLSNRQNEIVDGCRNQPVAIIIDFHAGNRGRCQHSMLIHSPRRAKDCCTRHCAVVYKLYRRGWQLINCFLENVHEGFQKTKLLCKVRDGSFLSVQ